MYLSFKKGHISYQEVIHVIYNQTPVCKGVNQGGHYARIGPEDYSNLWLPVFANPKRTSRLKDPHPCKWC